MLRVSEKISETFAATNVYSRTADDLAKATKVFIEHLAAFPPYDVIDALTEWTAENPAFPTVADIKRLVGERAKARFKPKEHLRIPEKPDERTFDERLRDAAVIHRKLCEADAEGNPTFRALKAAETDRAVWVADWMEGSIRADLKARRINSERAAELRRELAKRSGREAAAPAPINPAGALAAHYRANESEAAE